MRACTHEMEAARQHYRARMAQRYEQHERLRLDVMPLHPTIVDDTAYDTLDELRRFRHQFRHAYGVKLDPPRLQLMMHKALALKAIYADQMRQFVDFVQGLD